VQRKALIVVGASTVVSATFGIVSNIASSELPHGMELVRLWVWPIAGVLVFATAALSVWDRRLAGLGARYRPLPAGDPETGSVPRELPRDIDCFCGRDEEITEVRHFARSRGIVTICGKPGVGKSALAARAAHSLLNSYPDGQVFVDLRGLRGTPLSSRDAMLHVLRAFDQARGLQEDDIGARYRSVLAGRRAILFLDDAEDDAQVRPLLPPDKRMLVLITSRRPLAALTEAPVISLESLREPDALAMLSGLAGDQRVQHDIDASKTLVGQCGALPLALRIAAAQLRRHPHWAIGDLRDRLKDERRRLDQLRVGDLEVRACIALSYADLASEEARWFRRLAVIPGRDFSPETAATALGLDPKFAIDALDQLADAQLVEPLAGTGKPRARPRFRYHTLIRLFAEEKLGEQETPATRAELLMRVLTGYADQLDRVTSAIRQSSAIGPRQPGLPPGRNKDRWQVPQATDHAAGQGTDPRDGPEAESQSLQWLKDEWDNLMPVVLAAGDADPGTGWRLARSLLLSSEGMRPVPDLRAMARLAEKAAARLGDPDAEMSACYLRGRVELLTDELHAATCSLERSAGYFAAAGRSAEEADVLLSLGQAHRERRNMDEAAHVLARAFTLRWKDKDLAGAVRVANEAAMWLKEQGRFEDAALVLERAICWLTVTADLTTSRSWLAWAHENLGAILKHLDRPQDAFAHHQQSLKAFGELGSLRGQAHAMCNLGDLDLRSNRLREAELWYRQGYQKFREARYRRGESQALGRLAFVLLRTHRPIGCAVTLARCLIVTVRARYLGELLRHFRRFMSANTEPQTEPIANPALSQLVQAIKDAPPGIEQQPQGQLQASPG
jgi:tetratricopeptide (TPR) repeat protein